MQQPAQDALQQPQQAPPPQQQQQLTLARTKSAEDDAASCQPPSLMGVPNLDHSPLRMPEFLRPSHHFSQPAQQPALQSASGGLTPFGSQHLQPSWQQQAMLSQARAGSRPEAQDSGMRLSRSVPDLTGK